MSEFHRLRVARTESEIGGEAKTIVFDVPEAVAETFQWQPGQHLTLRVSLDGEEQRRSYTISGSPHAGDPLRITVKRVRDGLVSNYLNDHVEAGSELEVMPPFGGFVLEPGSSKRRTLYFFGAGSGITPLFAMIRSALAAEPHSVAHLLFGNRAEDSILFRDALAALCESHPERITVSHLLSKPGWFTSGESYWRRGRLDAEALRAFIDTNPPYAQDAHYFICGPGGMNAAVKSALQNIDVPADRIHLESFGGAGEVDRLLSGVAATATVELKGETHTVSVEADQTVLEAVRAAGLEPPFSCQSGVCCACVARLRSGDVEMRSHAALADRDVQEGWILTCQAVARTSSLEIQY